MRPVKHDSATRISIYNHKGGVGKTTLTMNLAATLAKRGNRVLLVDSDPQCNLTSYLLDDDLVDDLLDKSDSDQGRTIWSAVRPLSEAVGGLNIVKPIRTRVDNLFLVPGDIRLSDFETDLTEFWGQCLQRKPKGFRGTTAISELVGDISRQLGINYVFYDSGPNIGPLNRAILLDCDYFVIPVSCDLFSLRALKTLGRTLTSWISDWSTIADLAPEDTLLLSGRPRFLGYVPGGFRVYGNAVAQQHSHYLSRIEKEIHAQIIALLRKIDPELAKGTLAQFKLGELKHFPSLVPASQRERLPLYSVSAGTKAQREQAWKALSELAKRLEERISDVL